jgi:flap endonuclease-1
MGLQFREIVEGKTIEVKGLANSILVVDSFNLLYQFLSSIRSRDGSLLTDSNGNVTSHLIGLFSRTTKLMQKNVSLAFVFDGTPPKLKTAERERRKELKQEAQKAYEAAKQREDLAEMRKYASRTTKLTPEMIEDAKELVTALGLPVIQAPSEGEAQVANIVKNKDATHGVSQDYDSLLYGMPLLVRNLSLEGKRKRAGKLAYDTIKPEIIALSDVLNKLGLDNNQLIILALLVGTDYNRGGVKGIGPKTALKLVKEYGDDYDNLFKKVEWEKHCNHDWNEIYYAFKKMPVTNDYKIEFKKYSPEKIKEFLVEKHDFSMERVNNTLEKLEKLSQSQKQKGLGDFF